MRDLIEASALGMVLALLSAPAEAVTGNSLFDACERSAEGFCAGYILGVVDRIEDQALIEPRHICFPPGATTRQLIDVVMNYLRKHPEKRHFKASQQVWLALDEVWVCKK